MKVTDRSLVVSNGLSSGTLPHDRLLVRLREYMYRFTGRLNICRAQEMVTDVALCTDAVRTGRRAPVYALTIALDQKNCSSCH